MRSAPEKEPISRRRAIMNSPVPPRLIARVRDRIRLKHYSIRTHGADVVAGFEQVRGEGMPQ